MKKRNNPREGLLFMPINLNHEAQVEWDKYLQASSIEEQIISYADKFFSKNGESSTQPHTVEAVSRQLSRYGDDSVKKFLRWVDLFGTV